MRMQREIKSVFLSMNKKPEPHFPINRIEGTFFD